MVRLSVTVKIGMFMGSVLVFELQTGMGDAEVILQPVLDHALDRFAL